MLFRIFFFYLSFSSFFSFLFYFPLSIDFRSRDESSIDMIEVSSRVEKTRQVVVDRIGSTRYFPLIVLHRSRRTTTTNTIQQHYYYHYYHHYYHHYYRYHHRSSPLLSLTRRFDVLFEALKSKSSFLSLWDDGYHQ